MSSAARAAPPPAGVAPGPTEGVALPDLLRLMRQRWRAVALPTLAACIGATIFVQVVAPRYTGETKVLLESRDSALTRPSQDRTEQTLPIDEQAVASQAQVVMSRDLAREAIRRLKLVGNPEFDPLVDGVGPVRKVLMALGLVPNAMEGDPADRVLERYFDHLSVYPAGKSRILTVEFKARDPELAARAANTIADLYLTSLEAAKIDTARFASTWLGSNIDTLRTRVSEAESKVEAFRAKNGLIGGGTTNQPIGTQQLTELATQLTQARASQADAAAKAKLIKDLLKDGRAFDIPDVANNEMIRRLVEQRITLKAQLALESRTLLPGHPRIKELSAQLGDLEGQIRAAGDRTVRTLESDARIASARVESLQAAMESQSSVVARANTSEVQLRALEREAKAQRDQLESYLSRYREAAARDVENATPPDARVVSRAVVSDTPSFPKKLPIIGFTTVVVFLFAVGAVVARELLRTPATSPTPNSGPGLAEAGETLRTPALAPTLRPAPRRPVVAFRAETARQVEPTPPAHAAPVTEAPFDLAPLIARLEAIAPRNGAGRRLLVVGATGSDGLDALAEHLGSALAGRGRALIVGLDDAEEGDQPGLTDLVLGEAAFLEAIQSHPGSRVHRIGTGTLDAQVLIEEPQGLLITLDALGQAYDWVVCRLGDGASATGAPLLTAAAARMDAVVLASNAEAEDPDLVALYHAATTAGAAQVLVAQDRAPVAASPESDIAAWPLRRSA